MSAKPEYYAVLGLKKEDRPTTDDVKKAFRPFLMKYHPDRMQKLSEEERAEGNKLFLQAKEAHEVLTHPDKRDVYDRFGHIGLENMGAPGNAAPAQSGNAPPPRTFNPEDTFDFFDRMSGKTDADAGGNAAPVLTEEERRARRQASRAARRTAPAPTAPSATPAPQGAPDAGADFRLAAQVRADVEQMAGNAEGLIAEMRRTADEMQAYVDGLRSLLKKSGPKP